MAKRDHCKVGSRDYCANCSGVIELVVRNNRFRDPTWQHLEPEDPERASVCCLLPKEDADTWPRYKTANPRSFCWVVMDTSWHMTHCTRPVTDFDRHMCGIHANAARKAEEKDRKWRDEVEMSRYISEEVGKLIDRMKEEYGLEASLHHTPRDFRVTGKIVVDPVKLMELLEQTDEVFE